MAKKRKGFTWTRKKAWAICKGRHVVIANDVPLVYHCREDAEDECGGYHETVRPCEIIVKVKGD